MSLASVPRPGAPLSPGVGRGAPFGDGRRLTLVAGHDVYFVDLDLALEPHRREPGGEPLPRMLGHGLHVRRGEVQLPGDPSVREVQAHEVEAQDPDAQRLVVAGQRGACQVAEARAASRAAVAPAVRLSLVPGDRGALAARAADTLGPAVLADQLVALRVVDQRGEVHQVRHRRHRGGRKTHP